jgi:prenyltransferase/squalene oxidase-like repeat protein
VTDQQSELDRQIRRHGQPVKALGIVTPSRQSGSNSGAIAAGLQFLFAQRQLRSWSLSSTAGESAAWVTAYVLSHLSEMPSHCIGHALRRQIEDSLDWLMEIRTPKGGWKFGAGSVDDAISTAWSIVALRQNGRAVPDESLELLRRCRRGDSGMAIYPDAEEISSVDATAIGVRALGSIDPSSLEFLASCLRTNLDRTPSRLASRFFVLSTLMDWEPGIAPRFIVNAVRRMACELSAEGAWEQSLLLRCLMRLRMQTAWPLVAGLRRMQLPDGSWPGSAVFAPIAAVSALQSAPYSDQHGVLATVTAVSALAMGDLQPGLYFGSDLPFRRL